MNADKTSTLFTPILIAGSLILLISFAIRSTFGLFQIPIAEEMAFEFFINAWEALIPPSDSNIFQDFKAMILM